MSPKIRKRHPIKRKEWYGILETLSSFIPNEQELRDKGMVEYLETDDYRLILLDKVPIIFYDQDRPMVTIKAISQLGIDENCVTVDSGAVRFITNGADVMSPGIVAASEQIKAGDIVFVQEERHHKTLAVGLALIPGPEMVESDKGKAVDVRHYVGDDIWNMEL